MFQPNFPTARTKQTCIFSHRETTLLRKVVSEKGEREREREGEREREREKEKKKGERVSQSVNRFCSVQTIVQIQTVLQ